MSLGLQAFSVNASYSSTFGFSEEASSRIKIKLRARLRKAGLAPGRPVGARPAADRKDPR